MPKAALKKKPAIKKAPASKVKTSVKITMPKKPPVKMLIAGSLAPDFSMPATRIGKANRASLKGKPFVLYFYPKDNTSGCTAEACDFRDNLPAFGKLGIPVIGISKDGLKSHEKFAQKFLLDPL